MVDIKAILLVANQSRPMNLTVYQTEVFLEKQKRDLMLFNGKTISVCGTVRDVDSKAVYLANSIRRGTIKSSNGDGWIANGSMLFEVKTDSPTMLDLFNINRYEVMEVTGTIVDIITGSNNRFRDANFIININPIEIKKIARCWLTEDRLGLEPYVSKEELERISENEKQKDRHRKTEVWFAFRLIICGLLIIGLTLYITTSWTRVMPYVAIVIGLAPLIIGISLLNDPTDYREKDE